LIRLRDAAGRIIYGSDAFVRANRVLEFAGELKRAAIQQGLDVSRDDVKAGLYVIPIESQPHFIAIHGTPHNGRDGKGPAPNCVTGTLDDKAIALTAVMQIMNEHNLPTDTRVGQPATPVYDDSRLERSRGCSDCGARGCTGCSARATDKHRMALYRKRDGEERLTGVAQAGLKRFIKLDDPYGDLSGPGHEMCANEFISEMQQYDGSTPTAKPINVRRLDHEPFEQPDKEVADFDAAPPLCDMKGVWAVRSDDLVKIAVKGEDAAHRPTLERFWVHIVSVTVFGVVTGMPCSRLFWSPVGPDEPVFFDAVAVIGMKRGKHWEDTEVQSAADAALRVKRKAEKKQRQKQRKREEAEVVEAERREAVEAKAERLAAKLERHHLAASGEHRRELEDGRQRRAQAVDAKRAREATDQARYAAEESARASLQEARRAQTTAASGAVEPPTAADGAKREAGKAESLSRQRLHEAALREKEALVDRQEREKQAALAVAHAIQHREEAPATVQRPRGRGRAVGRM
jgi:hypothetical protein